MELNNQLPACKKCRRRVCNRESNKQQKYLTTAFMNMVSYNKVRRKACFQAFAYYYFQKFSNTKLLFIVLMFTKKDTTNYINHSIFF